MIDPRDSFTAKDYLEWMLVTKARTTDIVTNSLLEEFFCSGLLWGMSQLQPEKEFYQWLDLRDKGGNGK